MVDAEVVGGGVLGVGVLGVGVAAPDFTLADQNGRPVTLSAVLRDKDVLLVFFPLAFTAICQSELNGIGDHAADFVGDTTQTLAVSVAPPPTHKVWAGQSGFAFPLLSDFWPHGKVAQAYGVFNADAGFANRGTFVIDRGGVIRFAEMKGPGEPRDHAVWGAALAALGGG